VVNLYTRGKQVTQVTQAAKWGGEPLYQEEEIHPPIPLVGAA